MKDETTIEIHDYALFSAASKFRSIDQNEPRQYLQGVFIHTKPDIPGLFYLATNGHVLLYAYDKRASAKNLLPDGVIVYPGIADSGKQNKGFPALRPAVSKYKGENGRPPARIIIPDRPNAARVVGDLFVNGQSAKILCDHDIYPQTVKMINEIACHTEPSQNSATTIDARYLKLVSDTAIMFGARAGMFIQKDGEIIVRLVSFNKMALGAGAKGEELSLFMLIMPCAADWTSKSPDSHDVAPEFLVELVELGD